MRFRGVSIPIAGTVLILSATLWASRVSQDRRSAHLARPLAGIPQVFDAWTSAGDSQLSGHVLGELRPSSYLARTYRAADRTADLFIAYYARQTAGVSLHSPKNCLPGSGWEIWDTGTATLPAANGPVTVNRYRVRNGSQSLLAVYWYQTPQRVFASEYLGKVLLARDALWSGDTSAAIVRITVPDAPGVEDQALALAARLIPEVQRCLR